MKKSKTNKLELQRKTIRVLAERPLTDVAGGLYSRICAVPGSDLSFTCLTTGSEHC